MLKVKKSYKEITAIGSLLESQSLVDCLMENDRDFRNEIHELASFYKLDSSLILEKLVLNLSEFDLSDAEIEFRDLKTIAKLSVLSLIIPEFRRTNPSDEFMLDQMLLNNFMENSFRQA